MSDRILSLRLRDYAKQQGCNLSEHQVEQLLAYLELLVKWNKAYNLTAIREPEKMLTHHLLDSLSIAPFITGQSILDVGTGAGLPGIPLALWFPEKRFVLVDSVGKKIRFLRQVIAELKINNVEVKNQRVESVSVQPLFDVIMARAVSSIADLVSVSEHLLESEGRFVFQKGEYPHAEIAAFSQPCQVIPIAVTGITAKRHVIIVKKGEESDKNHSGG